MNLEEFLNYRKNCLSCGSILNMHFHSSRKQKCTYFNDRILVTINLSSIKSGSPDYKAGYSLDPVTNDFCIEFFDKSGEHWYESNVPTFLMNKFKVLDKNLGSYYIRKVCNVCDKYSYYSNDFHLDYKKCKLGQLSIASEEGVFIAPTEDNSKYKAYRITNKYEQSTSYFDMLNILSISNKNIHQINCEYLCPFKNIVQKKITNKTNLINFSSKEDLINKLGKLMIFS